LTSQQPSRKPFDLFKEIGLKSLASFRRTPPIIKVPDVILNPFCNETSNFIFVSAHRQGTKRTLKHQVLLGKILTYPRFLSLMRGQPKSDIDLYVIGRVKALRTERRISQTALAAMPGAWPRSGYW
jgi:hypothetical protein